MALVHSAPLSAAVTGKVRHSRKEMKASVKILYDLAFLNKVYLQNKHNNLK